MTNKETGGRNVCLAEVRESERKNATTSPVKMRFLRVAKL